MDIKNKNIYEKNDKSHWPANAINLQSSLYRQSVQYFKKITILVQMIYFLIQLLIII